MKPLQILVIVAVLAVCVGLFVECVSTKPQGCATSMPSMDSITGMQKALDLKNRIEEFWARSGVVEGSHAYDRRTSSLVRLRDVDIYKGGPQNPRG